VPLRSFVNILHLWPSPLDATFVFPSTDAFVGFCLLICLTDSNELFFVVIFSLKLFGCKSCSLLRHEALNLFIWRCATELSSSCL
jgi:hypothetical protein